MIKAIQSDEEISNEIGPIVHDLHTMMRSKPTWKLKFARPESNKVAHLLAKKAINSEGELIWLEDWPMNVINLAYLEKQL